MRPKMGLDTSTKMKSRSKGILRYFWSYFSACFHLDLRNLMFEVGGVEEGAVVSQEERRRWGAFNELSNKWTLREGRIKIRD